MSERIKVKLVKIFKDTERMKTFSFQPLDGNIPKFFPGQFVFLYADINGEEIERAYSIASSPLDELLELGLKLVENGKMTTYFHNKVKLGDVFEISRPQGYFKYTEEIKRAVLISGGSGITPMRSIIRYCTQKNLDTKITLLSSFRTEDEIIYKKEFEKLSKKNPHLKIVNTLTRNKNSKWKGKQGRISEKMIQSECEDISDSTFFICGPLKMVESIILILKKMEVNRKKIKMNLWGN